MNLMTGDHWGWRWTPGANMKRDIQVTWGSSIANGLSIVAESGDSAVLANEYTYAWEYISIPGYTIKSTKPVSNDKFLDFIKYTAYCLDLLYLIPTGKKLLDKISSHDRKVAVTPSFTGGNQYRVPGDGLCKLRSLFGNPEARRVIVGQMAKAQFGKDGYESIRELFDFLSSHWKYYSVFGTWPDDDGDKRWESNDAAELKKEGKVIVDCLKQMTYEQFGRWLMGGNDALVGQLITSTNNSAKIKKDQLLDVLRDNIIALFYKYSPPGKPADVMVDFNTILWGEHNLISRPDAVGLAHELIHAWYAIQGKQPCRSDTDVVLTEMACVGLGPWEDSEISDNRIRSEWSPPAMPKQNTPQDIKSLHTHKVLRPYYAWDEAKILNKRTDIKTAYPFGLMGCCSCKKQRGKEKSSFGTRWHRCTGCKRIYCDICGAKLESWNYLSRVRKCGKCQKQTELID